MVNRAVLASAVLIAFVTAGCDNPLVPGAPSFASAPAALTEVRGAGALGDGAPTSAGGVWRQVFDLDVGINKDVVYGTFDYIDSSFTKSDGNPPHFVVGPYYPETAIATFVQVSSTCVEFDGVGRLLNTGELLSFRAQVCDNGQPGAGLDAFFISVPQRLLTDNTLYQRNDMLSAGELTLSGVAPPALVITHMTGGGAIGDGAPQGLGVNRQVFQFEMGPDAGVVAGTLAYTDSSVIMAADGRPATLVVGLTAPGTTFTTFTQISDACAEFSGVASLQNTGQLMQFGGRACDAGPGFRDVFALWVPAEVYRRFDLLSSGDIATSVTSP